MSRWSAIAGYSLVGAATQLVWLNFAGVTTVAAIHYAVSETAIGWLAQVFPLLYVVLSIPCGLLLDRWFRPALLAGAVLTTLGALVRLGGDTFAWLLAGQLIASIAQPLVLNAVTGITTRYLPVKSRPTGVAIGTASIFAGMLLAFLLSAVLPTAADLHTMLLATAGFCVAATAVLAVALRHPGSAEPTTQPTFAALRTAWSDPLIRRLALLATFPFGVFVALSTFAQPLLEPAGIPNTTASLILLLNVIAGVLGSALIPIWTARHHAESPYLLTALALTAIALLTLALAPSTPTALITITLIGLLLLPALPVVLELVERRSTTSEGTATSLIWLAGNAGGLLAATATGLLVNHPLPAFLLLTLLPLLALPGAHTLRHHLTPTTR
ncbi:MFS transporter [Kribbella sandramycini]|uniref:MFS transporter n=1 Tax=Kribbella sandramycini TaxID=60450 RepID=A0A7Y4L6Y7_9ACTN|nr:MFS transporter [Kribbella sandramycini]MBB6566716.1 putative MFS family arabinose efflux permease [Kribbella sandramycini]NOL45502.1 MFS transporter [Kribbella sandramycini]